MMDHPTDDLELYALGMLEPAERDAIDAHVATCLPCLELLGRAEAIGAELASALPRHSASRSLSARVTSSLDRLEPRPRMHRGWPRWELAVAAAFALLIGGGWQNYHLNLALQTQDVILAQLVHSHFTHASLTTTTSIPGFAAKVLYARDGSWVYLIVDHAPASLHVIGTSAGGKHDLGEPTQSAGVASLFLHPTERVTQLDITVDGTPIATGNLVY